MLRTLTRKTSLTCQYSSPTVILRSCSSPLTQKVISGSRCLSTTHSTQNQNQPPQNKSFLSWTQSNSKISSVFTALILLGVGSTAYGVYEFYQMFTLWPQEVRADLRAGIKARNNGDYVMSEKFLRRALDTASQLPLERLSPDPYLKLSGIAIVIGEVLEKDNRPQEAYEVYEAILTQLQNSTWPPLTPPPPSPSSPSTSDTNSSSSTSSTSTSVSTSDASSILTRVPYTLTGPERVRSATISFKLAQMAESYTLPTAVQEKHLVFTVEELLRVVRDHNGIIPKRPDSSPPEGQDGEGETEIALGELELPSWVSKLDLVVPLETLGGFYSREGKEEYAVPLYLSALSVLSPSRRSTISTRCQGAHIMNSLASALVQGKPTPERRKQAEVWLRKALHVIDETKTAAKGQNPNNANNTYSGIPEELGECEMTLAVALFNLGELREMAGDNTDARRWYTASRKQCSAVRLREGVIEADVALRRLDKLDKSNP